MPKTSMLADFNAWNAGFMLLYFLNVINIARMASDPFLGSSVIALIGVQSGLVAWLAFSRRPLTALISTVIPIFGFYCFAYATGITQIPGAWTAGIAVGLPVFHVAFSAMGSLILGKILNMVDSRLHEKMDTPPYAGFIPEKIDKNRKNGVIALGIKSEVVIIAFFHFPFVLFIDALMLNALAVSVLTISGVTVFLFLAFVALPGDAKAIYNPALTHHVIEDSDHVIGVKFGKVTVFFCTRCSGMLVGLFLSLYAFSSIQLGISPFVAFVLDIFVPAPVFIDWGLQRFGRRKATTWSRIMTGVLTGFGFALIPQAAPDYSLHASIVLMSYFAVFFLIYFLSARRGYYDKDIEVHPPVDDGPSVDR
jgi:uncharacterized membrane protein